MEMEDNLKNEQICRLCLDIVPSADAEAFEEKEKAILNVLLINVDLHVIENAVACSRCMEELHNGFEFKSASLHVDNCISTFVDANVPIDMKEVFHEQMRATAMANVDLGNRQICQLCRSLIADEALDCNTALKDIIANCLPEVDIRTVHEPLVCGLCFSRVKKLNEFMKTCQEVERTINNYCQATADHAIPVSVSLNDLLKFKDSTISRLIKAECSNFDNNILKNVKKEDTASIECEEIHIKTELGSCDKMGSGAFNNFGKSDSLMRKTQIRQFTAKEHVAKHQVPRAERKLKCDKCTYETKLKSSLRQHSVIHMDKSEVEMHKCENCDFETRYKSSMFKHMVRHRDPKAEKKFKCDKCPYKTNFNAEIRRHNSTHKIDSEVDMLTNRDPEAGKRFKCDRCPFETDFRSCLKTHILRHKAKSAVQMHKCVNCEFETADKGLMVLHMLES